MSKKCVRNLTTQVFHKTISHQEIRTIGKMEVSLDSLIEKFTNNFNNNQPPKVETPFKAFVALVITT